MKKSLRIIARLLEKSRDRKSVRIKFRHVTRSIAWLILLFGCSDSAEERAVKVTTGSTANVVSNETDVIFVDDTFLVQTMSQQATAQSIKQSLREVAQTCKAPCLLLEMVVK